VPARMLIDHEFRWPAARMMVVASAMVLSLTSCGGLSEQTFETDSGSWILFTKSGFRMGGRDAGVSGVVEMDESTGCIYLHQPDFDASYPVVWPAGTVVTDSGLRLRDGRAIPEGEWVHGGGGFFDVEEVEGGESSEQAAALERCPGVGNQYGEVAEFDSSADELEIGEQS